MSENHQQNVVQNATQNKLQQTPVVLIPPLLTENLLLHRVCGSNKWRAWKLQFCEGRLGTQLPLHPKPAPHSRKKLHLDFPDSLPSIQKPVMSRNGRFALLPVLQPLLGHITKSSASWFSSANLQMVISEHFWAEFHLQDTTGFEIGQQDPNTNWKHLLKKLH